MSNTYMQIPSLVDKGSDDPFKGWFDIEGASHSIALEVTDFNETRDRLRTGEKVSHEVMEVKRKMDAASPALYVLVSQAVPIPVVHLAFRREDEKEIFLKYELRNVLITELSISVDDGEVPEEELKLNYQEIIWKFRPKLPNNTYGNWIRRGWDRLGGEIDLKGRR
jgi:type VI secretion system Hcp family effector